METLGNIGGLMQADCELTSVCKQVEPDTIQDKLEQRRRQLQAKLEETTAAIKFVNEHPEFVQFMDIVGKALRH